MNGRWARIPYLLIALAAGLFGFIAYNSGYGYDQLEYLVIGRSLRQGYALYDLIPSKSPGIYALVAAAQSMGLANSRVGLAVLIGIVCLATVSLTYAVTSRIEGRRVAALSSALVWLCMLFMELVYLQPTAFVYLSGLLAWWLALRAAASRRTLSWLWPGLVLSVGFEFKSVAAFYGLGLAGWLLLWARDSSFPVKRKLMALALAVAGGLAGLLVPMAYFLAKGRLGQHLLWTYEFPLLHYPSNTYFLAKSFSKLGWFLLLAISCCTLAFRPGLRSRLQGSHSLPLALAMGLAASLALLKTQASHYWFPAAGLLCIPMSRVLLEGLGAMDPGRIPSRSLLGASAAILSLACLSVWAYQPTAMARLFRVRAFPEDLRFQSFFGSQGRPGDRALFIRNSTYLYWISGRYPPTPFINTDVQTTYFLKASPGTLDASLQDPRLTLVEFNPSEPGFEDGTLPRTPQGRDALGLLERRLSEDFRPADGAPEGYKFWGRRPGRME